MKQIELGGLNLWVFDHLTAAQGIRHFVSDRRSGGEAHPFTLSYTSTPDSHTVTSHRARLAAAMQILPADLYFPSQVHGVRIVEVHKGMDRGELHNTDALITRDRGIGIGVMSADCVPILLYDKKNQAIAAVHSGWRGTAARILEKTLHRMQAEYNTQGKYVLAGIGPSVSADAYEVGEEVIEAMEKSFASSAHLFTSRRDGKAKLNLWRANIDQLVDFGVPTEQIEVSQLCTVKHNHLFFSARRGDAGRFGAGIVLAD